MTTLKREVQIAVRLSQLERKVLERLAQSEHVRISDALRTALRDCAKARGLWPVEIEENGT